MLRATILAFTTLTTVLACPDHSPRTSFSKRADGAKDWTYDDPSSWGSIKAAYATCSNGTTQSPIDLHTNKLSSVYGQTFNYTTPVSGLLTNWGYGPSFTLDTTAGVTNNPSFIAGNKDYYLAGFHTHTTSEHALDDASTPIELHLVHTDSAGSNAGVIGLPIVIGDTDSAFWAQILSATLPGTNSSSHVELDDLDMSLALSEVNDFAKYWTYRGSLTTPPCTEGLRWWVSAAEMSVSQAQYEKLMGVSGYSSRGVQRIRKQAVGEL